MPEEIRRRLPVPPPPRPLVVVTGLVAGVIGTGLLYSGATSGILVDLVIGVPLFGLALWIVGWPFVLSTALLSEAAGRKRRERALRS